MDEHPGPPSMGRYTVENKREGGEGSEDDGQLAMSISLSRERQHTEPESERIFLWIPSTFKEPKEYMGLIRDIKVSTV